MMRAWMLAGLVAVAAPQTPPTAGATVASAPFAPQQLVNPGAPPVIDLALRQIRAGSGGSSIARSAVRGSEMAFVYSGLGPCVVGAASADPARPNSITWRASGRVVSVTGNMANADVEWQRIEYLPAGVTAGPRVRMTLTLPLGERLAVDFVDTAGSACRADAMIFEIGVAADHGTRLSMSSEGRPLAGVSAGRGGGGGGAGRRLSDDDAALEAQRQRQGDEAARAAATITRPMPPREYHVDLWLLPSAPGGAASSGLAQKLSKPIGGTGGRFDFPPDTRGGASERAGAVDVSALVIPVDGEHVVVAITRQFTPSNGNAPASTGWVKAMAMPKADAILSFEMPAADAGQTAAGHGTRDAYSLRLQIVRR